MIGKKAGYETIVSQGGYVWGKRLPFLCKAGSLSLAQLRRALVNLGLSGGQREVRYTPDVK